MIAPIDKQSYQLDTSIGSDDDDNNNQTQIRDNRINYSVSSTNNSQRRDSNHDSSQRRQSNRRRSIYNRWNGSHQRDHGNQVMDHRINHHTNGTNFNTPVKYKHQLSTSLINKMGLRQYTLSHLSSPSPSLPSPYSTLPIHQYSIPKWKDNFYTSLLDWSYNNFLLAGYQNVVTLWNMSQVDELGTNIRKDYWVGEGGDEWRRRGGEIVDRRDEISSREGQGITDNSVDRIPLDLQSIERCRQMDEQFRNTHRNHNNQSHSSLFDSNISRGNMRRSLTNHINNNQMDRMDNRNGTLTFSSYQVIRNNQVIYSHYYNLETGVQSSPINPPRLINPPTPTPSSPSIPQPLISITSLRCGPLSSPNTISLGYSNGGFKIVDLYRNINIWDQQRHSNRIAAMEWKDRLLFTGGKDKIIKGVDMRVKGQGESCRRQNYHNNIINNNRVIIREGNNQLPTSNTTHTVSSNTSSNNTPLSTSNNTTSSTSKSILQFPQCHTQQICGLSYSPSQNLLASGGNDNSVYIYDIRKLNTYLDTYNHNAAVKALVWLPGGKILVSGGGSADKKIIFWGNSSNSSNRGRYQEYQYQGYQYQRYQRDISINHFGNRNNIGNSNNIGNRNNNKIQSNHNILRIVDTGSQVCSLTLSPTSNQLISCQGFSLNHIIVWNLYGQCQRILHGHKARVLYSAISPNGDCLATGAGGDQTLKVWKMFKKYHKNSKLLGLQGIVR